MTKHRRYLAIIEKMENGLSINNWRVRFLERMDDGTQKDHGWTGVWAPQDATREKKRWEKQGPRKK